MTSSCRSKFPITNILEINNTISPATAEKGSGA
jgi:hypothetical protein